MKSDQIAMEDLLLIIIMVIIIVIIIFTIVIMNVDIVFLPGGSPTSFIRNETHQMFCCSKLYGQTTLDFTGRRATICLSDRVLSYP